MNFIDGSPNWYLEQTTAPIPQARYSYSNRYDTVSVRSPDIAAPRPKNGVTYTVGLLIIKRTNTLYIKTEKHKA